MHITGKVQVNILHRDNLRVAAACCAAFNTEDWSERRLPQCQNRLFADFVHCLSQPDADRRFSLSCGSRVDGCNQNQFAVGTVFDFFK